ncbi:MAG: phospholipid carrier-dependent glycosyltransferase [Opitutaceae bacterium]
MAKTFTSHPTWTWIGDLVCLAIVFAGLYLFVLGRAPLDNPDEGRYAEIPREMLASHDWVTPRLDGVNYFEKPPLVYWCVAAAIGTFGSQEFFARLTPALFGLLGVLLTYAAARRLFGRGTGLAAGVVLGTSLLYAGTSRFLVLDIPVSVLMAATLLCFILGVREPPGRARRWLFWGLYASSALATLSKGLIGCLLTGLVMFLWLLLFNQWKRLRPLHLPSGIVLFLAIAAPWHVLAALRNPTWAHFYFIHEQWDRFTSKIHDRYQPFYFFVPILIAGLFPWIGFLGAAARRGLTGAWSRRDEAADRAYFLVWAAIVFLFFSASDSKLIPYILPIFPALAIVIGDWLSGVWRRNAVRELKAGIAVFGALAILIAAGALFAVLFPKAVRVAPEQASALHPYATALAAVLIAGALAAWFSLRRNQGRAAILAVALTGFLTVAAAALATPYLNRPGTKPLALMERALGGKAARVYSYNGFFHDFTYYADRTVDLVNFTGELEPENDPAAVKAGRFVTGREFLEQWRLPGKAFVVGRKRELAPLMARKDFHYRLIGRTRYHYLLENR